MMAANTDRKLIHAFAALADLGQEIADADNFQEMIRTSLHLLLGSLAIRRGALAEFNERFNTLHFMAVRGVSDVLSAVRLDLDDVGDLHGAGLNAVAVENLRVAGLPRFSQRHRAMLETTQAEVLIPLVVSGELVGLVLLGGKLSGEAFSEEDGEIVCALARHIGVGLQRYALTAEVQKRKQENIQLYGSLRDLYQNTVRALATALDLKDKRTQSHSERVGQYCAVIARELGWRDEEVEGMAVAGYLHDVGKLVVERELISAPYPLDARRSPELRRHPMVGYEILAPIKHPYVDIAATARYHHERPDGTGYPDGLTDERIPLSAKIVAVADAFDEMTQDQPYRQRLSIEKVCAELADNAGTQFAPEAVTAFARALLKELDAPAAEQRITSILGRNYLLPQRLETLLPELIAEAERHAAREAVRL
jgi:HD-GYP domain-containing protein (c-di-GMP phosphodiesterase class II)